MKPRTQFQRRIVELSSRLPSLSYRQQEWAERTALPHLAYRTKKQVHCLDCGSSWDRVDNKRKVTCPCCGLELKVEDTAKRSHKAERYFYIIDTIEDLQVHRLYQIIAHYKRGTEKRTLINEVSEQWIREDGKFEYYSLLHRVNYVMDSWQGDWAIRRVASYKYWATNIYNISTEFVYPEVEVLPIFKKLGFNNRIEYWFSPLDLCKAILSDNRAESLLKMKQYEILGIYINHSRNLVDRYWRSICICNRNNYRIKNARIWLDYLDCLHALGKDVRNPKNLCLSPKRLKIAHDLELQRKKRADERRRKEEEIKRIFQAEENYQKSKANFIGFSIEEEDIKISVLNSVQEFLEEGEYMHHCVFALRYYEREDSLILSAMVGGVKTETIELSLPSLQIAQSFGRFNSHSEHHDRIVNLMNRNIKKIEERMRV